MQKDSAGEERNPAVPRVYKHGYKNVSVWRLKQSDFNAEIQKDNKKRPRVSSQHVLYPTLSVNYTYLPGMSFVCAPNIDTQNSNPASISFINIEQNSSGPLSCSLCAKRQTHDGNECLCIASHVPSFQPMQLSITY